MYKEKYNIGELNRRPIFENWEYTQDAGGGNLKTILNNFFQWAKIEDRFGSQSFNQAQQQWQYDCKVIVRYNPNIVSNTTMVYANARYTINSITIVGEQPKRFQELRCTKIDGDLVTSGTIIPPFGPAYVFDYTATGGEDEYAGPVNKTIIGAFKDGQQFEVLFVPGFTAGQKQVLYTASTGKFLWSVPFVPLEQSTIQYI